MVTLCEPLILHPHVRVEYLSFGELNNSAPYVAEERKWRALWRAGRGVWEGGGSMRGSEGWGAGSSSTTIEGNEDAAAAARL